MSFPRYPKYIGSGVEWLGRVPAHWQILRLKYAAKVFPSNVDKKSHEGETPVLLCNYTDVYYNDTITTALPFMPATASEEQIVKFSLRTGDTIVTKDSETADDIAIGAYVPEDLPGVVCGYHLSVIRPLAGWSGAFIKHLFDSTYVKSRAAVLANGLTRVGLGQYELANIELPFPPKDEQYRITHFLQCEIKQINQLIAEQQRLIELLKEKRQAVISHAVTKGLDPAAPMKPSGVEWLGDIPAHWELMPIRKAAKLESGHTPSRSHPEYWLDCTVPWFTLADVWQIRNAKADYVSETKEKISHVGLANSSARLLPKGTVMLSRTASVGFSAIMGVDMATTQDFANWVCGPRLDPAFLLYVLRSMKGEFQRLMMGSTHNTIYMPDIQSLRLALPPLTDQMQIVEYVRGEANRFDDLADGAESAIALLQERRTSLVSAAVTGKIDVREYAGSEGTEAA